MFKGCLLYQLRRCEAAIDAYQHAIADGFLEVNAWIKIGHTLLSLRRYDEALAAYEQAISLQPHAFDAWEGKISALVRLHRRRQAWAAFRRAMQLILTRRLSWLTEGGRAAPAVASSRQQSPAVASSRQRTGVDGGRYLPAYTMIVGGSSRIT